MRPDSLVASIRVGQTTPPTSAYRESVSVNRSLPAASLSKYRRGVSGPPVDRTRQHRAIGPRLGDDQIRSASSILAVATIEGSDHQLHPLAGEVSRVAPGGEDLLPPLALLVRSSQSPSGVRVMSKTACPNDPRPQPSVIGGLHRDRCIEAERPFGCSWRG